MEKQILDPYSQHQDPAYLYFPDFLQEPEPIFETLLTELELSYQYIRMYGKELREPRQTAYYADPGICYQYSGKTRYPKPWPPTLQRLREDVCNYLQTKFNSCLVNHYVNGQEYMGWHRDDEKELGPTPIVASLSLGEKRSFQFRNLQRTYEIELISGSLFVMLPDFQSLFQHQLPKRLRSKSPRLNLSFRRIF